MTDQPQKQPKPLLHNVDAGFNFVLPSLVVKATATSSYTQELVAKRLLAMREKLAADPTDAEAKREIEFLEPLQTR